MTEIHVETAEAAQLARPAPEGDEELARNLEKDTDLIMLDIDEGSASETGQASTHGPSERWLKVERTEEEDTEV